MEKLGIGYADLRARKPDIIYAALSGFGVDGPYRDRPSFAPVAEAMSGWMRLTGDLIDHNGPPIRPAEYHGDLDPAMWAIVGILAALRHKERTGEGQLVDVAQLDVMIAMTGIPISNYLSTGKLAWEIWEERPTVGILFGFFEAKDGYVYVAAEGGQVDRLKQITGKELESPDEMQEWVSDKTKNDVIEALIAASIPVAPVYQLNEMVEDPQVKARNMIIEYEHPIVGKMRQPNFPIKFSKTPSDVKPAPALGQHNEEILKSLGYTDEQITAMRKAGAIL
jgi:CoA:oxalate CoA-transferase